MSKPKPDVKRIYASIAIGFLWLIFLAMWLFYYATSFGIIQNIGVFIGSIAVVGIVMVLLWVPWAMKHAD